MLVLVKKLDYTGKRGIFYADSPENSSREEKLQILVEQSSLKKVKWEQIIPDKNFDWINQRDENYQTYSPVGDKQVKSGKSNNAIFRMFSGGIKTGRDIWAYDSNRDKLVDRSHKAVNLYNNQLNSGDIENFISNPAVFKWHRESENSIKRGVEIYMSSDSIRKSAFRPFYNQYLHYEKAMNNEHYRMDNLYPIDINEQNILINVPGKSSKWFSSLMTVPPPTSTSLEEGVSHSLDLDILNLAICITDKTKRECSILMTSLPPDLELVHHNQTFGMFHYKKVLKLKELQGGIFDGIDWNNLKDGDMLLDGGIIVQGTRETYVRYHNVLDETLKKFIDHTMRTMQL